MSPCQKCEEESHVEKDARKSTIIALLLISMQPTMSTEYIQILDTSTIR